MKVSNKKTIAYHNETERWFGKNYWGSYHY